MRRTRARRSATCGNTSIRCCRSRCGRARASEHAPGRGRGPEAASGAGGGGGVLLDPLERAAHLELLGFILGGEARVRDRQAELALAPPGRLRPRPHGPPPPPPPPPASPAPRPT